MRPALALALVALTLVPPEALAGKREAQAKAKAAQKLFREGDFVAALAEYTEAQRQAPLGWEYQYDIGLCEAKLGHYTEALAAFDKFLREGSGSISKKQLDATLAERDRLRESTAEVTVRIEGESSAEVFVDGESVGKAPFERPLVLKPGDHSFQAKAGPAVSAEKAEKLVAGSQKIIVLKLVDKSKEPAVLEVTTDPEGAEVFVDGKPAGSAPTSHEVVPGLHIVVAELEGHSPAELEVRVVAGQKLPVPLSLEPIVVVEEKPFPVAGVVIGGAGVLSLVGAMALGANAQYNRDLLTQLYRQGGTWDDRYAGIDSTRKSSGVFSGIFGVLGGAAIAGGATLILLNYFLKAPPPEKKKPARADEEEGEAPPKKAAPEGEEKEEAPAQKKGEEREERAPEEKKAPEPEGRLLLAPIPGGVYATWTVTF